MSKNANFAQPEIALRLDESGVIRKALFSSEIANEGLAALVGRRWADTVGGARAQVDRMIRDAHESGVSPIHRVRQRFPSGVEMSVDYTALRLGVGAGFIAIGRNLEVVRGMHLRLISAQNELARGAFRLHDVATRHRLLLDASSEPVLIVHADSLVVDEVNPAARRALGVDRAVELLPRIAPSDRASLRATLDRVRHDGVAADVVMKLGVGGGRWHVRASLVQAESGAMFLLRLSHGDLATCGVSEPVTDESPLARLREPAVAVDAGGVILRANRAFVELVQHEDESAVRGQPLDRWLSPSLTISAVEGGQTRSDGEREAPVRGKVGADAAVEIHSVRTPDFVCVVLRRVVPPPADSGTLPSNAAELDAPGLRRVIDDRVAAVERQCLLAAVEVSRGDRQAVADILGIRGDSPSSSARAGS